MHWRRGTRTRLESGPTVSDPVVLTITRSLDLDAAMSVAAQVERLPAQAPVVIDLTAIPSFDTDGAELLLGLQDRVGAGRLMIVGFRQAAARLVGSSDETVATTTPAAPPSSGWAIRRLRNLAVVAPEDDNIVVDTDHLEPVLARALAEEVAILVVDLRYAPVLTSDGLHAITFASSSAAVRGQELLVVNVTPEIAETLRRSGLSATTYVAPEPPPLSD